jgi:uncharacterized RDD family membrane protein YckC
MNEIEFIPASLGRRLAALVYDGLLMFAVLVIASALTIPFTGGKGAEHHSPVLTVYFLAVIFLFNGWFWTHGGQTLGMRAWRIQLLKENSEPVDWKQAFYRFLASLPFWTFVVITLLVGNKTIKVGLDLQSVPTWVFYVIAAVWLLIDQQPNNWRDRISKTRVRYFDKNKT